MKKILVTFCFLTTFFPLLSQTLTGIVKDSLTNASLQGADVVLMNLKDSTQQGVFTDAAGKFVFSPIKYGDYQVSVQFMGYAVKRKLLTFNQLEMDAGVFGLREDIMKSDSVKIMGDAVAMVQKGDTTEYNANAHKMQGDATTEDLVKKMSGLTVDNNGVQVQGENVQKVLVDGKPFFDNNPKTALLNLPARAVKKVQVYDEKDKFNSTNDPTKTMNIVTRPEMREGIFGKLYSGYGTDNKYIAGGNFNSFNGVRRISFLAKSNNINEQGFGMEEIGEMMGFAVQRQGQNFTMTNTRGGNNPFDFMSGFKSGISTAHSFGGNYNDSYGKKWEAGAAYFFNANDNVMNKNTTRQYVLGTQQLYREDRNERSLSYNHKFTMKLSYKPDSLNSFEMRPSVAVASNDYDLLINSQTSASKLPSNATNNISTSLSKSYTIGNVLNYSHAFSKARRMFYVNMRGELSKQDSKGNFFSQNTYYNDSTEIDTLNQQNRTLYNNYTASGNIHFTEPIDSFASLGFDYAVSFRKMESDKSTYNYALTEQNYSRLDSNLTNNYDSRYYTQTAVFSYNYSKNKLNIDLDASAQFSRLAGTQIFPANNYEPRNFFAFLPRIAIRNTLKNRANFHIVYGATTSIPDIAQLQNVVNNQNPILLTIGNPNLKQTYTHSLRSNYRINNSQNNSSFQASIRGDYQQNSIAYNTIFVTKDTLVGNGYLVKKGVQLQQAINLNGTASLNVEINKSYFLKKIKSRCELRFNSAFRHRPAIFNGQLNHSYSTNLGGTVGLRSDISERIEFAVNVSPSFPFVRNSLNSAQNTSYFSLNTGGNVTWFFWKQFFVESAASYQYSKGLSANYTPNYTMWSGSVGTKLGKKQQWKVSLYAFDILRQNRSIGRNVSDSYIEDTQTNVLTQYFMLKLNYNFNKYKGAKDGVKHEKRKN